MDDEVILDAPVDAEADKPMKVKVIVKEPGISLIEYLDENAYLQRCYVPTDDIEIDDTGQAWTSQNIYGPEFGVPWAELLSDEYVLNFDSLQHELRRYGVWEYSDLVAKPDAVRAALNSAFRGLVDTMKRTAKSFEE